MNPKITRRQLAGLAVISLDVVKAAAQTPADGQDLVNAARESHRRNSTTLAQFEIPMSLEPAFLFKA